MEKDIKFLGTMSEALFGAAAVTGTAIAVAEATPATQNNKVAIVARDFDSGSIPLLLEYGNFAGAQSNYRICVGSSNPKFSCCCI